MLTNEILIDGFTRAHDNIHQVLEGLVEEQLLFRPSKDANSIAWLLWHLTRVQDDHIAEAAGGTQCWHKSWAEKFDLPYERDSVGYGHSTEEVGQMKVTVAHLRGYYDDVHTMTIAYLSGLTEKDYRKIVDDSWEPPVTLAVRLVSVLDDISQHIGQAAYIKGLVK